MTLRIPLSSPDITETEIAAVTAVLRTNSISLGPKLAEFEDALAARCQVSQCIAVSSGTAGLHLAIRALDIGEGDEVIVPSFAFIAVANAVRYERASPVFVDIDPITLNIVPALVEAAITSRTRAIVVVHTFGVPAEMEELISIAHRYNLTVIEDACEAIGGTYKGNPVGSFGDISVFGFYPNKQITTGEGGAVLTGNDRLANRIRALRNQGRYPCDDWLQHSEIGYNYRLSELACALGLVQLSRLDEILRVRAEVARCYDTLLSPSKHCLRPSLTNNGKSMRNGELVSWFVYVIQLKGLSSGARDRIAVALRDAGIGCARYFAPIHQQPAYAQLASANNAVLPVTNAVAQTTLALPFFNRLLPSDMEQVVNALNLAIDGEIDYIFTA